MEISWDAMHEQIAACEKCILCRNILNKVPGQGNPNASLMFIGEGPGADEDLQGLAFVGRAGKKPDEFLTLMCKKWEDFFISNVKIHPTEVGSAGWLHNRFQ